MKPNELRIGNFISRIDLGNKSPRIETILELLSKRAVTSGPCSVIVPYEDIEPIPLTEEWLLKFGFRTEESSRFELDNIQINTSRELMWINTKCKYNIEIGMPDYIHQLQNLYFSLTNTEL